MRDLPTRTRIVSQNMVDIELSADGHVKITSQELSVDSCQTEQGAERRATEDVKWIKVEDIEELIWMIIFDSISKPCLQFGKKKNMKWKEESLSNGKTPTGNILPLFMGIKVCWDRQSVYYTQLPFCHR